MFSFKLFVLTVLIATALCGESGEKGKHGKHGKNHEKHKKCMNETKELKECCPFPGADDDMKNDPDCKQHLDGIENKEKKEKFKAYNCFSECIFKKNGLLENGELKKDVIQQSFSAHLNKNDGQAFQDITNESIDFCFKKLEEKKADIAKWKAKHQNMTMSGNGNGEKKCTMLPNIMVGCIMGNVVRNCPAEKFDTSEKCTTAKDNATSMDECTK